jgi:hypothetical protein
MTYRIVNKQKWDFIRLRNVQINFTLFHGDSFL